MDPAFDISIMFFKLKENCNQGLLFRVKIRLWNVSEVSVEVDNNCVDIRQISILKNAVSEGVQKNSFPFRPSTVDYL